MNRDDPVSKLIEQLMNADSESRHHEQPPEIVIYVNQESIEEAFVKIYDVDYNYEENRIHIYAK